MISDSPASASPFPGSPVVPSTFDGTKVIRFRCHPGIACFNACCRNIDISLTPYDILRLKHRLGLSSTDFLARHTFPYEMEQGGIAGVKLKPVEGGPACAFMTEAGCSVYADRPTACRYYPIALLSLRRQGESFDQNAYALVEEEHCLGHREPRELTVDDYRAEQGLPQYDDLARGWRQLVLKKKSSGATVGKPSARSLQLFFMACYDIDRFRAFVASDAFRKLFALAEEDQQAAAGETLADDTQLMLFGFRFLRQVLFGEESVAVNEAPAKERRERYRERVLELEREAAERLAREEELREED
jgi:uncharacterized protein